MFLRTLCTMLHFLTCNSFQIKLISGNTKKDLRILQFLEFKKLVRFLIINKRNILKVTALFQSHLRLIFSATARIKTTSQLSCKDNPVQDQQVYEKIECTCSEFLSCSVVLKCVSNPKFIFHHIQKFKTIQFHGICKHATKMHCVWIYN